MRTYLVVIDGTPEAEVALRFAARRAAKTGGGVQILALIAPTEFVAFGGVQATIEAEARESTESIVNRAAGAIVTEAGITPTIVVKTGESIALILETIHENPDIGALVLGAAVGAPGPLIAHFAGAESGSLPCPLMIVPGSLDREALDRLS
ncbi:universal stress protein [Sphingomonas paeninsulae]|uniref:Universal stress protein n=1 Tax=Sphingomonas paeninsulae TaxID=2319844 RepID=A0A494TEC4_SPHPE|nr:universal stress protein [Sphingomonas paeninsulae]AYJ87867.1 universal stress protein [Sphingomonas paeninsulae]